MPQPTAGPTTGCPERAAAPDASRRTFIKQIGIAGAGLALGSGCSVFSDRRAKGIAATVTPRVDKLRLAYIGVNGIGHYHLDSTRDMGITCPCYCDVDASLMEKAAEYHPDARPYQDYREMFDKEHENFDAVIIGTPDHHHYPATIIAMQLGKHVYTQKPLTHTVWEARALTEAAKRYPVVTQMGNQGHAGEGWRLVYEWIHSGAIGEVTEVHTWSNRPIWPQGMLRPEETDEIPAPLNWDVWLGPAPMRPFKSEVYHRFNWRGWWDFGAGALGDMACHTMDGVFYALDPGYPTSIEPVASTPITEEAFPKSSMIKWEFPRKGRRRAFTSYWYDGGLKPTKPEALEAHRELPTTGNLFVGTKDTLLVSGDYGNSPRIIPESRMKEIGKPPKMVERSPGHFEEWIMACKGEKPIDFPKSSFSYAGPFTEAVLLGNVALRVGRRIEWDGDRLEVTNIPEANQYIDKEYREGWRF